MRKHMLVPVINATGILLHTNLGRAPLAAEALAAVAEIARGYSNLEYDLESGDRGSRYEQRNRAAQRASPARRTRSSSTTAPPRCCSCSIRLRRDAK